MIDILCCKYNSKDVIAHFTDTSNEIMIDNKAVKLDDPLLTKVFTTKFLFTLKPQLKDETMPNFWKLTPAILNMDKSRINLIWQKDTVPDEVADNVGMLSINFNDLNITRQIINYIKLDQHFYLDNDNQPDPKEDYINLSLVDWFAEYFKWQYFKTNDKTAYLYMQCLKKQFVDNPIYKLICYLGP